MSELVAICGTTIPNRRGDVVFVHGLNGDARATWQPEGKPGRFWPSWLCEDYADIGVWSIGYEASSFGWKGSTMPLADRAVNALILLESRGIGKEKPVIFITHSLGGLLVKEMLRKATDNSVPEGQQLAAYTRGVVFLSTPHSGSDLASFVDFLKVLKPSDSVRELKPNEPRLRELNTWYRNNVSHLGIETQVYCERKPTKLGQGWFKGRFEAMVVDANSSDPGIASVTAVPVDEDHLTISCPERNSLLYQRISQFVSKLFSNTTTPKSNTPQIGSASSANKSTNQTDIEQARRFEAAMPEITTAGQRTEVRTMIALENSIGLRAELPDYTELGDLITKTDVKQGTVPITFPREPNTGEPLSGSVFVTLKTSDFDVDGDFVQGIYVSPKLDSGVVTFLIVPKPERVKGFVVVKVFKELECNTLLGSLSLCARIVAPQNSPQSSPAWQIVTLSFVRASETLLFSPPPTQGMTNNRLGLIQQLNGLSLVQFNAVVFALQPPTGLMPPPSASQGDRVFALLSWAEGTGGCGLEMVWEVFQTVLTNPTQPSNTSPEQSQTPSAGSINVGGDVSGSAIITGHGNTVNIIPQPIPQPPLPPPNNVPRSGVAKFIGREADLEQLHSQLQQGNLVSISAVQGMGGVGKTELAIQYTWQYASDYEGGIFWLFAREFNVGTQVVGFAQSQLNLKIPEGLELLDQVAFCWRNWREGQVLLVLDDVTNYTRDIQPYLPPAASNRFKVLMTTRLKFGSPIQVLSLDVLSSEQSLELLTSLIGEERVQEQLDIAKTLCEWLGFLPLGIELVGRYLIQEDHLSLSLATLLFRLQEKAQQRLAIRHTALQRDEEAGISTAQRGVEAAFELSWQVLDEPSQHLGKLLSLFALAPIPWQMAEAVERKYCENSSGSKEFDVELFEDSRAKLVRLHLLQLSQQEEQIYRVHSLIREFFKSKWERSYGAV
jgi:pimeloyl-ACP methyl ester carboxylesterase